MQNPPPSQQPYGTPSGPIPPPGDQKSSVGLEPNLGAALSYIWVVGLIFFFLEKDNRFIRFHAMQSVLLGVFWMLVIFVLVIINIILAVLVGVAAAAAGEAGGLLGIVVWLLSLLVWTVLPIGFLAVVIFTAVKAYQGKKFMLPVVGKMAEKIAG